MLAEAVTRLADALDTGIVPVYPLARMIHEMDERGIKSYPAVYNSTGQYRHVLDDSKGIIYHRINGSARISSDVLQITSCGNDGFIDIIYPVKQVIFTRRDVMQCSDIHADEELVLWAINKSLKASLSGTDYSARIEAQRFTLDSVAVLSEEYSRYRDMVDINYEWSYVSVDYNIIIKTNTNCLCNALY